MEVYSSSSRKRLSDGLKKMHIKPTVYFPKVRNEKKSNISRKSSRKI